MGIDVATLDLNILYDMMHALYCNYSPEAPHAPENGFCMTLYAYGCCIKWFSIHNFV
jgi:hypothetical protein